MNILKNILKASWDIYLESSPYMLFGFFVAGILYVVMRPEFISNNLGKGKVRSVIIAAIFGVPLPLCSCGVIPVAAGLKRQGANNGATLSFLISTPETGIDSIPITYALMDPIMTVMRPVAAFITALIAGIAENFIPAKQTNGFLNVTQPVCSEGGSCCSCGPEEASPKNNNGFIKKLLSGLKYSFVELLGDIGSWFIVGLFLAGLITGLVPDSFFESYMGNPYLAMIIMLLAGMPIYVCATASTPIAAALILKGLNPGAALVFLLAGPATNIATMTMISGLLGRRTLLVYLGAIMVSSLALGLFTDLVYLVSGTTAQAAAGHAAELVPDSIKMICALVLGLLLSVAVYKDLKRRFRK
ncbi:MAG: SO_0444 family Cu/Zn efflux transporter [Desulfobacterales bacterium]|nr:SO_0444 family Cu/Zn efflux transporter [Desulfobacterales bacterium]